MDPQRRNYSSITVDEQQDGGIRTADSQENSQDEDEDLNNGNGGQEGRSEMAGDEVGVNFGGNFKEDRIIVRNPALNIKYRLVERPRFLLQFN